MLQLQSVIKIYKTKAGTVNALDGVSLTFPATGLVFITGKSGCGKTTLLNVIGGLDGIDGGEIFVQDKRFSTFSATEYDSYRNTFIGFIFQEYNLLPEFTVEKNIKIAMELQGRQVCDEELESLLKEVGIAEFKDRFPSELSGGQRQRVAIARALIKQPRIIMADEPTGALDSETGEQVLDTLKKLSQKTLVIVVSHDREFAERYADRIIHLVDGKVAQDVTFTEKEMESNVSEQGDTLVVREGSELTESEKDAVAKAVKERKSISVVENLSFRDKAPTGEVARKEEEPVALRKSKMKMRSSVQLGIKSLVVKPVRLIVTILISAIAFAVFGLFDTIANFSTASVLKNQVKSSLSETVTTTQSYVADYEVGDRYDIKISQAVVDEIQGKSGGVVKGIFDLYDNTQGGVKQTLSIAELITSEVPYGKKYYTKTINGFVEFDGAMEISKEGKFKDFDYTLVLGEYPKLTPEKSIYQVAISTYLADSIMHYLAGNPLNGKKLASYEDFLGATITVNEQAYTVVGLIDCGEIPEKYHSLQTSNFYNTENFALINDFASYIDSKAEKCIFTAKGFLAAAKQKNCDADLYQMGNAAWTVTIGDSTVTKKTADYLYCSDGYGMENITLFSGNYPEDGKLVLADDEILIHSLNLEDVFAASIKNLSGEDKSYVIGLIGELHKGTMEGNRKVLRVIFDELGANTTPIKATIHQRFDTTGEKTEKQVKIVGIYFGIDLENYTSATRYKMMMNGNLMSELGVYAKQGSYTKLLFSKDSLREGADTLVQGLLSNEGFSLTWYNNSALNVILTNEKTIRQVADLFLYAAIALSVFSIFMLYNYISVSIANKKQSVGVLRALGAGGKDILLTFLCESLIVSIINGILANVFAWLGCSFVNAYIVEIMNISVHFALFGGRQILIIAAVSLLTAIASSTTPIVKIAKKKPIELIRRP